MKKNGETMNFFKKKKIIFLENHGKIRKLLIMQKNFNERKGNLPGNS